jgi:hypothetical protein
MIDEVDQSEREETCGNYVVFGSDSGKVESSCECGNELWLP